MNEQHPNVTWMKTATPDQIVDELIGRLTYPGITPEDWSKVHQPPKVKPPDGWVDMMRAVMDTFEARVDDTADQSTQARELRNHLRLIYHLILCTTIAVGINAPPEVVAKATARLKHIWTIINEPLKEEAI